MFRVGVCVPLFVVHTFTSVLPVVQVNGRPLGASNVISRGGNIPPLSLIVCFFMKKNVGFKGKILSIFYAMSRKMSKFSTDTLAKISQNIFEYFTDSETSASLSLFQKQKHLFWLRPGGLPPLLVRNLFFIKPSLRH